MLAYPRGDLAATLQFKFLEHVVNVRLCRRQANVETASDILVAQPRSNQLNDLPFASGEH